MTERFPGTHQTVPVGELNRQMVGYVTGRLSNNHVVPLPGDASLIGKFVNIRLEECRGFYYMGRPV